MAAGGSPVIRYRRPSAGLLAQAALCATGVAATSTLYGSFFATGDYLSPLIAAALAGTGVAAGAALLRVGGRYTGLLGVAGFVLCAVYLVLPGTLAYGLPTWRTAVDGLHGISGGWAAMLSIGTPAPVSARLLMAPAAIGFTAAFAATTAALRTRGVLGPAIPLLAAELCGLLVVADRAATHFPQAVALLFTILLLTLLRVPRPAHTPLSWTAAARRVAPRVAVLLLVAAASLLAARAQPLSTGDDRLDPRALIHPALRLNPVLSPLGQVRAQAQRVPAEPLFTVDRVTPGGPDRMVTATLDTFDGSRWTSSDAYLVAGPALAPGPVIPGAATVTEHITITGLTGPYLPAAGRPVRVDRVSPAVRTGFDARSGVLVSDTAALAGLSYTVTSLVRPVDSRIADATVDRAAYRAYTVLPTVPPQLADLSGQLADGSGAYATVVAIRDRVRQIPYSVHAPPGESYGTLLAMLAPTGGTAGDTGQHVAAFTLLARAQGLPVRIAVGYRLTGSGRPVTVTSADAYAWAQVHFRDYGWVDVDPTDVTRLPDGTGTPDSPPPTVAPTAPVSHSPVASPSPATVAVPGPGRDLPVASVAGYVTTALLAIVALAAALNLGAKVRRRRRRRTGGPSQQVAGAWLEATDRLIEAGVPVSTALTAEELAEYAARADTTTRAGRRLARGAATLAELAPLMSYAVFAPQAHSPTQAGRAWLLERRLRGELYPGRLPIARLLHRLKPLSRDRAARSLPRAEDRS